MKPHEYTSHAPELPDALALRGAITSLRQYHLYGRFENNEPDFRASTISWLKEALGRLESM